jgi:hypothetical protein
LPHSSTRSKKRRVKSPAPQTARQDLYDAYSWFVAAFRTASEKLRSGDLTAKFPPGSFLRIHREIFGSVLLLREAAEMRRLTVLILEAEVRNIRQAEMKYGAVQTENQGP